MSAASLLREMLAARPGSKTADAVRWRLETAIMKTLQAGGRRAVLALVRDLNARGHRIRLRSGPLGPKEWHEDLDGGRTWTLYARSSHGIRAVSVAYRTAPPPLSPRQQKVHDTQEAFYARYNRVAKHAYARSPEPKLPPDDRLVLLIGEFEADVNNGGFSQYLDNKGRRRARSALAALKKVKASRTADLLSSALEPGARLGKLDDRFYRAPEDLARLAMKHLAE